MSSLPDGLIFEFSCDRKGKNLKADERELVKCKNCYYSDQIRDDFYCYKGETVCKVESDHFCSYGRKPTENL